MTIKERERKRKLPLSIAAIKMPTVKFEEEYLTLEFVNWSGEDVVLWFDSPHSFRWTNNGEECNAVDDDLAFEVYQSNWINDLKQTKPELFEEKGRKLTHYQFCIYGCWVFEVICKNVITQT